MTSDVDSRMVVQVNGMAASTAAMRLNSCAQSANSFFEGSSWRTDAVCFILAKEQGKRPRIGDKKHLVMTGTTPVQEIKRRDWVVGMKLFIVTEVSSLL